MSMDYGGQSSPLFVPSRKLLALLGLRILLVDDSIDVLEALYRKLKRTGAETEVAFNGEEAIDYALRGDFDVIVMDVQMPKLDGVSCVERLRSAGFTKPIVALTSVSDSQAQVRCREAGFSAFLTKPIDPSDLIATIAAVAFHQVS
jgi:CheY-like chemotaxis protein